MLTGRRADSAESGTLDSARSVGLSYREEEEQSSGTTSVVPPLPEPFQVPAHQVRNC